MSKPLSQKISKTTSGGLSMVEEHDEVEARESGMAEKRPFKPLKFEQFSDGESELIKVESPRSSGSNEEQEKGNFPKIGEQHPGLGDKEESLPLTLSGISANS